MMKKVLIALFAALPMFAHAASPAPTTIVPQMTHALPGLPGMEGTMVTVTYAPGAVDPVHQHHASVFLYVLEGTVVMQVQGGPQKTLQAGQSFYEGPNDVHIVGRNASMTKPAKFLVFFVKPQNTPLLTSVLPETH